MTQTSAVILCLAYILGLLSTAVSWGGYGLLALGIGVAILQMWGWGDRERGRWGDVYVRPKPAVWLAAGVVGLLATMYFQARIPQPAANDISKFVASGDSRNQAQLVTVQGKVASMPRLTRSQKSQFWLEATQLNAVKGGDGTADVSKAVTGKLYVTVPLVQATSIHPGQAIAVTGSLYKPKPPTNPGAFDFQAYLAKEGTFAGLKGRRVQLLEEQTKSHWGWWAVRQRIIRSQIRWLGSPEGPLVSSIVLGHQMVDLPYDIQDQFAQVGLAHAIVASGLKVSLILGLVLSMTRRLSQRVKFSLGTAALVTYAGLTGFHPPVLRAAVMGFGALIALVVQRKRKPLGSLLVAATLLLLFNPLWIWDIGFELSFLATLGLIVTVPPLIKRLDWLPPAIASLVAVSITALVWTLPLQLQVFSVVPLLYNIVVNILSTPLICIISIGGILSAVAALIWPLAGSALAWLLYYPTYILIAMVQFFCQLPGNSVAVGTISVLQLSALYGLIGLVWLQPWWQRRWWLAGFVAIGLVLIPVWQTQATMFRVTVLAATAEPVLVIQDHEQVTLVNSGDANTARFTVLPFLQHQGINQVEWAIATNLQSTTATGWLEILQRLPVKTFYQHSNTQKSATRNLVIQNAIQRCRGSYQPLKTGQMVPTGSTSVQLIDAEAPMLQLQIQGKAWLLLGNLKPNEQKKLALTEQLPRAQVLWWSGEALATDLLQRLEPEVAIASSATLDPNTASQLRQAKTQLFWTGRDGAIQWTPSGKFQATTESTKNNASFL